MPLAAGLPPSKAANPPPRPPTDDLATASRTPSLPLNAFLLTLADLTARRFDWSGWERLLRRRGVEIDRPAGTAHPDFPEVIYPLDYGFIPGTHARPDGEAVDCFCGSAPERIGLAGLLVTEDHRQGKRELNLLWGTTPAEVYCAHGFLGFAPRRLESAVALRHPMHTLWNAAGPRA